MKHMHRLKKDEYVFEAWVEVGRWSDYEATTIDIQKVIIYNLNNKEVWKMW